MNVSFLILWCGLTGVGLLPDDPAPAYFQVQTITHEESFAFPVFSHDVHPDVALKINRHLQLSELELLDGYQQSHLFERVVVDHGTIYGGKVDLTSQVLNNTSRLLSVYFDEASCGMTCAYWHRYYNFNPANGDLIQLQDLVEPTKYDDFREFVYKRRLTEFCDNNPASFEYLPSILEDDDLADYYLSGDSLVVDVFNCLSKFEKVFGTDAYTYFSFNELRPYLNDYEQFIRAQRL